MHKFILVISILFAQLSYAEITDAFLVKAGGMSFTQEGDTNRAGSTIAISYEWERYLKTTRTFYAGYRTADDDVTERTLYQATYVGTRYFYLNPGYPIRSRRGLSIIKLSSTIMPYATVQFALGRALLRTLGGLGGVEASSEFYSITLGTGTRFGLASIGLGAIENLFGEAEVLYEIAQGYGEFPYSGSNIYANIGISYYF